MRNSPISARTKLGETITRKFPRHPIIKHKLNVSFLPQLSTSDPTHMYPKIEPRKNMPIAVEMISDF
jgi:hypothetical protein